MNDPGAFPLAELQIASAIGPEAFPPIIGLDGANAATLFADFAYGSGGTTCSAIIATSLDGGSTWRHICRFDFATATAEKWANLSGFISVGITAYADLGTEGVTDGLLGDRLCAIVESTGTYVNTTLRLYASVR